MNISSRCLPRCANLLRVLAFAGIEGIDMLSRKFTVFFSRLLLASVASLSLSVAAQTFPCKPVKLVVPYPAGGFPDTVARVLSKALTEKWNQQVIIDNRPGGSGAVAAQTIKSAGAADGYTLLVTDGSMFTINPAMFAKLEYNAIKDFVSVTALAKAPLFLAAHPDVPATTFAEFVTYVKTNPGKVACGSSGIGSTHHLTTEAMSAALGLNMIHPKFLSYPASRKRAGVGGFGLSARI